VVVTPPGAGTFTYSLTCTGGGGSGSGAVALSVTSVGAPANVAQVVVDGGPAGVSRVINRPYVNVTVCRPGTNVCQTIDHVLVDTGATGLRLFDDALAPLALPAVLGATGKPLGLCGQFAVGFMWGSVRSADVKIAGETASSISIQQVGDAALSAIPASCAGTGPNIGNVAALGARGILGVGLRKQDCGAACAATAIFATYYECAGAVCSAATAPLAKQVSNPVAAFSTNNNGVVLVMPAVPAGGVTSLTGSLVFGINTQNNNQLGSATVYAVNNKGNFTTNFKGVVRTTSFLDSGSNGLFFPDSTIPLCTLSKDFYCPPAPLALSVVTTSPVNGASGTVNIVIENVDALDGSVTAAVIGGIADVGTFNFGLPFFFGRSVFVAIEGTDSRSGTGPYWAY
jgi:hypothetical protein